MQPFHYILLGDKLGLVAENIAEAALVKIKAAKPGQVKDAGCNLPIRASGVILAQLRTGDPATIQAIQRDFAYRFADFAKALAGQGSSLLCARVSFGALVHFRYWWLEAEPVKHVPETLPPAPEGYRYCNRVLCQVGEWQIFYPMGEDFAQQLCDLRLKDGRTYEECWPDKPERTKFTCLLEDDLVIDGLDVAEFRYLRPDRPKWSDSPIHDMVREAGLEG
jgi:hypothetical protein